MLIIKVFVNERQIDEIMIHNISGGDISQYKIKKPMVDDVIIQHERAKGWKPLLHKALEILIKKEK